MDVKIKTSRTFTDILHGPRIVILQGGTRSGKSYSAVQYLVVQALQNPNTSISIVRKSFPSLRISTLRDFKEIMRELNLWNESDWRASENLYSFDNGSTIEFLSVQDGERRKGTKRDILFVDEANELDWDDMFQLFIRTTQKTVLAYNPSFPVNHWIYTQMLTHPEAERYISTYEDNPFLENTIIEEIERLRETSPSYWKVYGEGREGMSEGLIFDNFSVIDYIPENAELLGYGCDWGFTNDPSTMVALFKTEEGIVLDEIFYLKGLLTNQLGSLIKEAFDIYGKAVVIGDSSEPRTLEEIFRMGINIKPAIKGPDSILSGIDIMKQHKILITKKSQNMLNEFYSYLWAKDKNGDLMNQPDSRSNDHAIDAARYITSYTLSQKKKNYGTYTISLK